MGAEHQHRKEPEADRARPREAAQAREAPAAEPVPVAGLAAPTRAADPLGGTAVDDATAARLSAPPPGRPLQAGLRRRMEQELQADLGSVRVHDDASSARLARDLGAAAFTHGSNVYLGGQNAGTERGQHVLAHELAHVAQQQHGTDRGAGGSDRPVIGRADDPLEAAAETSARRVVESLRRRPGAS